MGSLNRLICAFRGHEDYLHFERNRVYLQCVACGYESPGWTIGERPSAAGLKPGPTRATVRFPFRHQAKAAPPLIRKVA